MEITTFCDLYAHCERSVAISLEILTIGDCPQFLSPQFLQVFETLFE